MGYSDKPIIIDKMIEKHMKKNNMTMKELGEKVGKGESTVSMWISGKSQPRMGTVQKLSDIFNISTDELIYGDTFSDMLDNDATITYLKEHGEDKLIELYKKIQEDGSLLMLMDKASELSPEAIAQILRIIDAL